MKSIMLLFYIAMIGLICSVGGFLLIQIGFKPLIGSYAPTYEDVVASGVVSIAASYLMMALASLENLEKSLKK